MMIGCPSEPLIGKSPRDCIGRAACGERHDHRDDARHQQGSGTKMAMLSFCGIDVAKDRLDVMVLPGCWNIRMPVSVKTKGTPLAQHQLRRLGEDEQTKVSRTLCLAQLARNTHRANQTELLIAFWPAPLPQPPVAARPVTHCRARSCLRGRHIRKSAYLSRARCTRHSRAVPTCPGLRS